MNACVWMCPRDVTFSLVCTEVVLWLSLFLYWLRRSRCSGRQKTPDAHFRAAPLAKHSALSTSGHTSTTGNLADGKTNRTSVQKKLCQAFCGSGRSRMKSDNLPLVMSLELVMVGAEDYKSGLCEVRKKLSVSDNCSLAATTITQLNLRLNWSHFKCFVGNGLMDLLTYFVLLSAHDTTSAFTF